MFRVSPILVLALAACDGGGTGGTPTPGQLGQIAMAPECGAFNQACLIAGLDAPIAAGALVEIGFDFRIAGSSGPPVHLEATRPSVVATHDTFIEGVGAGNAAVLVKGPDDKVLDFIHLWVRPADELRVMRYSVEGIAIGRVRDSITLLEGDELLVAFEAYAGGQPLIGQFELEYDVEGEAIRLLEDSLTARYRLVAKSPGEATLILAAPALDQRIRLQVEVLP